HELACQPQTIVPGDAAQVADGEAHGVERPAPRAERDGTVAVAAVPVALVPIVALLARVARAVAAGEIVEEDVEPAVPVGGHRVGRRAYEGLSPRSGPPPGGREFSRSRRGRWRSPRPSCRRSRDASSR